MDTSETYIRMCEKAEVIQQIAEQQQFDSHGNYYADSAALRPTTFLCCDCGTFIGRKESKRYIWLPKQDQLQEMMGAFSNPHPNRIYELALWGEANGLDTVQFETWEQFWLAFVMKEKYSKVWDGNDWVTNGENPLV